MNSVKKHKNSIAICLLLALTTNQASAFSFAPINGLARYFSSIFIKKKPVPITKKVCNWLGNNVNVEDIFWGTAFGSVITVLAIYFFSHKTPPKLFKACRNGDIKMVKKEITNGADINYVTRSGITPMYIVLEKCAKSQSEKNIQLLWHLLDNGADIESAWKEFETSNEEKTTIELINLLEPYLEYIPLSQKDFTQKNEKTKKILELIGKKSTPMYIKQKEFINIIELYQAKPEKISRDIKIDLEFIKEFAKKELVYSTTFLQDICDNNLVEFFVKHEIIDRNKKDIVRATSIYCKNEQDMKAILTHFANHWDLTEHEKYEIAQHFVEKPLSKKIKQKSSALLQSSPKNEEKITFYRKQLEKARTKNPVFYREMLHQLNSTS